MEQEHGIDKQIKAGLIEEKRNGQGIPYYVSRKETDLEALAFQIKAYLEKENLVAHDFSTKVWNKDQTQSAQIDYRSGWPIDGIADGELE